jgi:hypothetical protein
VLGVEKPVTAARAKVIARTKRSIDVSSIDLTARYDQITSADAAHPTVVWNSETNLFATIEPILERKPRLRIRDRVDRLRAKTEVVPADDWHSVHSGQSTYQPAPTSGDHD